MEGSAKHFLAHKKILCEKAPFFDKMFSGSFQEGTTQCATLPEEDLEAFKRFIGWIYHGSIEVHQLKEWPLTRCIHLFALAEKYGVTKLADQTMDWTTKFTKAKSWFRRPNQMALSYRITHQNSKLLPCTLQGLMSSLFSISLAKFRRRRGAMRKCRPSLRKTKIFWQTLFQ